MILFIKTIDIVIIGIVLLIISNILYFNFIKNKGSKCSQCAIYKRNNKSKNSLKRYYEKVKNKAN